MKNILLLQTGGTIAMHFDSNGTNLNSEKWSELLYRQMPELEQLAKIDVENVFFEDSSDINKTHWINLALKISEKINKYDGFVILHGTDTMAYTASALSFALRYISKPVILTGSQVPMSNIRSDAKRNVINAVELATLAIPEVAICFNDRLFRGNRSTKMSIGDFDAFASPNYPEIATIGIKIKHSKYVLSTPDKPFSCNPVFDNAIHLLKIYPSLNPDFLDYFDLSKIKAVIIESYGIGNMPVKGDYSLIPFVKRCRNQNCHVIVTSQAAFDAVDLNQYTGGRAVKKLGGLSAGEMTMEATITKTMHLLAQNLPESEFRKRFNQNMAGERS